MDWIQLAMAFGFFSAFSTERTSIGCAPDDWQQQRKGTPRPEEP